MTELTLTVPQGIGDTYWVYQVFAKHVDALHFRVATVVGCPAWLENRADGFLKGLPKVRSVGRELMSREEYLATMRDRFDGGAVVSAGGGRVGCNGYLEAGERIETVWPGHEVYWNPPLPMACPEQTLPREYLLLFVGEGSGMRDNPDTAGAWTPEQWAEFTKLVIEKSPRPLPVVVVGAEWDRHAGERAIAGLAGAGIEAFNLIGLPIAETTWLIRHARLFLCYQAGLKVIADRFDVPQVVLWFPRLDKMRFTFCKPHNISSGRYQAFLFTQTPHEAAEAHRWI